MMNGRRIVRVRSRTSDRFTIDRPCGGVRDEGSDTSLDRAGSDWATTYRSSHAAFESRRETLLFSCAPADLADQDRLLVGGHVLPALRFIAHAVSTPPSCQHPSSTAR